MTWSSIATKKRFAKPAACAWKARITSCKTAISCFSTSRPKAALAVFLALAGLAHSAQASELKVKRLEQSQTFRQKDLAAQLSTVEAKVYEPHEHAERRYRGFRTVDLLREVFGPDWLNSDEVVFQCADGYESVVPVERLKNHPSYLAFESPGRPFRLMNQAQGKEDVALGPYYLVWGNLEDHALRKEDGAYWPYQVVSVELIRFEERYPKLVPPKNASKSVRRGFEVFRTHCMTCHSVNGQGGKKGIDLNAPVSVTEYWKEVWLKRWISDPAKMRPGTAMPPLDPQMPDRQRALEDVVRYLRAMAKTRPINP